MLLLPDSKLLDHFKLHGKPLPFSLSTLRKDRLDGRLGVPYRSLGGQCLYCPADIEMWLSGTPVICPKRNSSLEKVKPSKKLGKPTKAESVEAQRKGISVRNLRAQQVDHNEQDIR